MKAGSSKPAANMHSLFFPAPIPCMTVFYLAATGVAGAPWPIWQEPL
jgi:hypothetical protein